MENQQPNTSEFTLSGKTLGAGAHLAPELNRLPEVVKRVHFMGVCGTGMASLAGLLKTRGYEVTGSDQHVYPPMSDLLKTLSIPLRDGYDASHLHSPTPDLVIVGNVITRENPEAVALGKAGIPYLSFPQGPRHFALEGRRSVVVSGTHGKTTTASLVAWILQQAGEDPGFMIGGIPRNFRRNFRQGKGPFFVVEGDEYDTAFFDKGPKFVHYNPWAVIVSGIEFDHADIYRDLAHVVASFRKLLDLIPRGGMLIANGDDPVLRQELKRVRCPALTYGLGARNDWTLRFSGYEKNMTHLEILPPDGPPIPIETPMYGEHNLSNLLSATALSHHLNIPRSRIQGALHSFMGVRRRLEVVGRKRGVWILDDFAHHPTAVRKTVQAVRERHPGRRLIVVFEPRSNSSRRNIFQSQYAGAFAGADRVLVPRPPLMEKIPASQRFSSERLVKDLLDQGLSASYHPGTDELLESLIEIVGSGDLVLFMSNGGFDNLPRRLLERI